MNLIFHIGAAAAFLVCLWQIARLKAERDLLRALAGTAAGIVAARVTVDEPERFLARFAAALGVAFEPGAGRAAAPARLEPRTLFQLFVERGLTLIRCTQAGIELHVSRPPEAADTLTSALSRALGGLPVVLVAAPVRT